METGDYGFDCPTCDERMDILGFDVDEDFSFTFFVRCRTCDGEDEDTIPMYLPVEFLQEIVQEKRQLRRFAEFMRAIGFPDPEGENY